MICFLIIVLRNNFFNISKNYENEEIFGIKTLMIDLNCDNKNQSINFNISLYEQSYSSKYNIIELKYYIHVFDENNKRIKPFDLPMYYDLHIFCITNIISNKSIIESFPNFNDNINFICSEQFEYSEKIELGIKIYRKKDYYHELLTTFYYFNNKNLNLLNSNLKNNDDKFSILKIQNEYMNLFKEIKNRKSSLTLKASYFQNISFKLKTKSNSEDNIWKFKNIYNHYYCFCKGIHCFKNTSIFQDCKYLYYLTIIDKFRNLYEKTEYLLADFILTAFNDDDIFPIFKQMIKQNISAHYMTPKNNIFNEYCSQQQRCLRIIREDFINGDFLEKYLELILKLKVTVAGSEFRAINNLFYNIEYITSINIGHGVKFFKSFLYKDYTSPKKYNKLVLAPSSKLISIAKNFGWKEENIIKFCLPKWDKYMIPFNRNHTAKSIFFFFTWRNKNPKKTLKNKDILGISKLYIYNILKLLNDTKLTFELNRKNITLYFGLHHNIFFLQYFIVNHFKFIKIINNEMISTCLLESSLIVSDFSSVIFDFIYQKKPVIIYIPDYNDTHIKDLYSGDYYNLIKNLGNGTIYFENQFYNTRDVIDKIIFYINNNFKVEKKIEKFYDSFEFNCGNNIIQRFIDNLKILK